MSDNLIETEIELEDGQKWVIVHNLPQIFGIDIQGALDNYLARTDSPTAKGFCAYIKSKDSNLKAWPRMQ